MVTSSHVFTPTMAKKMAPVAIIPTIITPSISKKAAKTATGAADRSAQPASPDVRLAPQLDQSPSPDAALDPCLAVTIPSHQVHYKLRATSTTGPNVATSWTEDLRQSDGARARRLFGD